GRVRREQREVDPFAVPGRPLGIWQAFLYRGELWFGRVHVAETMTRKRRAAKCADRTMLLGQLLDLRQVGGDGALPQGFGRLGPGEAAPPGEPDTTRRHRAREGQD